MTFQPLKCYKNVTISLKHFAPVCGLYQICPQLSNINVFFFSSSTLENISVASAMQRFSASNKKKIIQFIYQSFGNIIGIII